MKFIQHRRHLRSAAAAAADDDDDDGEGCLLGENVSSGDVDTGR